MRILFLFLATLVSISAYAQKIKYKKDRIEIDKELAYHFVKTQKNGFEQMAKFELRNLDNELLLSFSDSILYYDQLPYELEKRKGIYVRVMSSPVLGKKTFMEEMRFSLPWEITRRLEETSFFKDGKVTDEVFNALLKEEDHKYVADVLGDFNAINASREANWKKSSENFSEFEKRTPKNFKSVRVNSGKIFDGGKEIGKLKVSKSGSYAVVHDITNLDGEVVAIYSKISSESKSFIRTMVDNGEKNVYVKKDAEDNDYSIAAIEYLVNAGYL